MGNYFWRAVRANVPDGPRRKLGTYYELCKHRKIGPTSWFILLGTVEEHSPGRWVGVMLGNDVLKGKATFDTVLMMEYGSLAEAKAAMEALARLWGW